MNCSRSTLFCAGILCVVASAADLYTVSGRVIDAHTGKGIERARVTAEVLVSPPGIQPVGTSRFTPLADLPVPQSVVALTDEEGAFSFTNLPHGPSTFSAEKPGYLGGPNRKETSLKLVDNLTAPIQFSMIHQAVIEGKIVDENGRGIASQVSLWRLNPQKQVIETVNAGGGIFPSDEFRFYGLEAGAYYVQVISQSGPVSATYPPVLYPHALDLGSAEAIQVEAGQQEHIEFKLKQVSAYKIRGRFSGSNANASINLHLPGLPSGNGLGSIAVDPKTQTFEIGRLAPGVYILEATTWSPDGKQSKDTKRITAENHDVDGIVIDPVPVGR